MATLKNKRECLIAKYRSDKATQTVLSCCVRFSVPGLCGGLCLGFFLSLSSKIVPD